MRSGLRHRLENGWSQGWLGDRHYHPSAKTAKIADMIKDPDERRAYQARWMRDRRKRAHAYLGGKCAVCGATERLEFHHRDPEKKSFNISRILSRQWETVTDELDKCELRCASHHGEAHEPAHGTASRYSTRGPGKCRCDLCLAAWREYKRGWEPDYRADKKKADPFYRRKKPMDDTAGKVAGPPC